MRESIQKENLSAAAGPGGTQPFRWLLGAVEDLLRFIDPSAVPPPRATGGLPPGFPGGPGGPPRGLPPGFPGGLGGPPGGLPAGLTKEKIQKQIEEIRRRAAANAKAEADAKTKPEGEPADDKPGDEKPANDKPGEGKDK